MKIINVEFQNKEALFKIEEFPQTRFRINLTDKQTKQKVLDELNEKLLPYISTSAEEQKFNDFELKNLEGTEI